MNPALWMTLATLVVTGLGGLAWLGTLTWHGGRQSQRLDAAIHDLSEVKRTQGEHSTAIAGWSHVAALLEEVRKDVKTLQFAKNTRRSSGTGD